MSDTTQIKSQIEFIQENSPAVMKARFGMAAIGLKRPSTVWIAGLSEWLKTCPEIG
jgi:hypothetical protein